MKNYFTVDEISAEIGLNRITLYKKAKLLGIDTSKITKTVKKKLINACKETISRKEDAKEFEQAIKSKKVAKKNLLVGKSGKELEIMLELAIKDFDNNQKSIEECQFAIEEKGTIINNGNNGTISSNPAVKTKTELLKSQSVLRKDILTIKQALESKVDYEDEENPFGDE